jgi:hypothetical protein
MVKAKDLKVGTHYNEVRFGTDLIYLGEYLETIETDKPTDLMRYQGDENIIFKFKKNGTEEVKALDFLTEFQETKPPKAAAKSLSSLSRRKGGKNKRKSLKKNRKSKRRKSLKKKQRKTKRKGRR